MRRMLASFFIYSLVSGHVLAQEREFDLSAIDEINSRYEKEYEKIQTEAASLGGFDVSDFEGIVGKKLETSSRRVTIAFDTPSVDMRVQEMKFHIAQVSMNMRSISFDIPEFVWGRTNIGPVKLDLPKIYSKRIEIKTKIPEFSWEVTSIKTKIPEFYMHRQEIKFDIPEFKLIDVSDEVSEIQSAATALQAQSASIEAAHKGELRHATELSFIEFEGELTRQMEAADGKFAEALAEVGVAIEQVGYYGIDPTRVRNEDGTFTNLIETMETIQAERDAVRSQFETAIQELKTERSNAVAALAVDGE
jgi:hypothetical protein